MSPYVNWHVGMKVVCVDASWREGPSPLVKGHVYTVAGIGWSEGIGPGDSIGKALVVDLCEVKNPTDYREPDSHPGFVVSRFRPVHTRKSDISIFTAMLQGTNSKVSA